MGIEGGDRGWGQRMGIEDGDRGWGQRKGQGQDRVILGYGKLSCSSAIYIRIYKEYKGEIYKGDKKEIREIIRKR